MKITYLREFIVLSEIGNFQIAADELFSSQPTLSRHIKLLEESLGVTIFDRTTRKIELNEYGKLLLPYAKEIVRLYDKLTDVVAGHQRSASCLITIGSIPPLASYNITGILEYFKQQVPSTSIRIVEGGSYELIRLLEKGICDFAFVRRFQSDTCPLGDEFASLTLCRDRMVALIPSQHPLAVEKELSISQFENENLLLPKGDLLYNRLVSAFSLGGFRPKISFIGSRTEDMVDMVKKGMGITFSLESSTRFLPKDGISMHTLTRDFIMDINLTYLKSKAADPPFSHFLTSVNSWISDHADTTAI